MKTRLVITTNQVGSDGTIFCEYNIYSPQGMARVRYWAGYLAKRQGLPVSVYTHFTWQCDGRPLMTLSVA
jgi:hypothetical protein